MTAKLTSRGKIALLISSIVPFFISKMFVSLIPDASIRFPLVALLGIICFILLSRWFSRPVEHGETGLKDKAGKAGGSLIDAFSDSWLWIEGEAVIFVIILFSIPLIGLLLLDFLFIGFASLLIELAIAGLGAAVMTRAKKSGDHLVRAIVTILVVLGISYGSGRFVEYRKSKVSQTSK